MKSAFNENKISSYIGTDIRLVAQNSSTRGYIGMLQITEFPNGEYKFHCKRGNSFPIEPQLADIRVIIHNKPNYDIILTGLEILIEEFDLDILDVYLPYFPYVRMDREIPIDERSSDLFGLKIFARRFNNLGIDKLYTINPHNKRELENQLYCKTVIKTNLDVFQGTLIEKLDNKYNNILVIPDKGAAESFKGDITRIKATEEIPIKDVIYMNKVRDPKTGNIQKITVNKELTNLDNINPELPNKVIFWDDLCSRGGTFCWGLKSIQEEMPELGKLYPILVVAHAEESINSGDVDNTFKEVICTNSVYSPAPYSMTEREDRRKAKYTIVEVQPYAKGRRVANDQK